MGMKLCVYCEHILTEGAAGSGTFQCDRGSKQNPVDGKVSYFYCETMRMPGQPCGPDATLFEEKE